jgi:hypothetical protein
MIENQPVRLRPKFRHYCAYGVSVASELPLALPELRQPLASALFEVEIRAFEDHDLAIPKGLKLQNNPSSGLVFGQLDSGSSYVRWEDVGEVLISSNGRSIACRPFRTIDSEAFQVYLLGQAFSFALVKGGFEPLHATAVTVGNRAVAFLADCGFGKSTLAAAFLQAGHRLITDDLLLLQTTMRRILAFPGPSRIKLFPEMAHGFLGEAFNGVPLNSTAQKQIIPLSGSQMCTEPIHLAAIYALTCSSEANEAIHMVSLSEREAFITLLGSTFNRVVLDADRLRRQFEATERLANAGIVKRLLYPRSLACLPRVRQAILSDVCAQCETAACEA